LICDLASNQSDPECLSYPEINEIYQELSGLESSTPPKMPDNYYPRFNRFPAYSIPFSNKTLGVLNHAGFPV